MADASFRDMSTADIPAGLRLCRQSGWNQTEADWRLLLEPPSRLRVAVLDGQVVGSAGAVVYGSALAWICMVLVDPAFRGRGLGTRLVTQVLEALPRTASVGLDATPQGRPVYERLGFRDGPALARHQRTPAEPPSPLPSDVGPLAAADLPRMILEDAAVFGADRSRLLRHAASAAPELAWCTLDSKGTAYALGRRGQNADQIGPVVAPTLAQARSLVAAALSGTRRRAYLDAPDRPEWRTALADLGFRVQRSFTRMYRSGVAPPSRPESSWAILGPEFA